MSNEPASTRLLADPAPESQGPASSAAMPRAESAALSGGATLEQLRTEFAAMTETVAQIRSAVVALNRQQLSVDVLLQEFEARSQRVAELLAQPVEAATPDAALQRAEEQAFAEALAADPPGEPAAPIGPEAAAETERVPTVSSVVSQLGRADEAGAPRDAHEASVSDGITTVAMLGAMVEQLAASMPIRAPEPEQVAPEATQADVLSPDALPPEAATPDLVVVEPVAPDLVTPDLVTSDLVTPDLAALDPVTPDLVASDLVTSDPVTSDLVASDLATSDIVTSDQATPEMVTPDVMPSDIAIPEADTSDPVAQNEAAALVEPLLRAVAAPGPAIPEAELLSSFARVEAVPYLPPEVGTAVIFDTRARMPPAALLPPSVLATAPPDETGEIGTDGVAAVEPLAADADQDVRTVILAAPQLIMPPEEPEPADAEPAEAESTLNPLPVEQAAPQASAPAEAVEPDLDKLLFEPAAESDTDPAAFLLEPPSWPQRVLPEPPADQATTPEPDAVAEPRDNAASAAASIAAAAPVAAHDPLAAIKAMSEEERIALFE